MERSTTQPSADAVTIAALEDQWGKPISTWRRIVSTFFKNWSAVAGMVILLPIVVAAIFAPAVAPISPTKNHLPDKLTQPIWSEESDPDYLLGTDLFGRDIFSRLVFGARASLSVAFIAGMMAMTLGVTIGLISGYFGGTIDSIFMRLGDAQIAFPFLVIAITIISVCDPSFSGCLPESLQFVTQSGLPVGLIILIGYWGWVSYGKVTRAQVLSAKQKEYVEAAHVIGTPTVRIITRHLLPNVVSPLVVMLTLSLATLIIVESSLSFLGLGIQPPTPSWGSMLAEGRNVVDRAWWVSTFPGIAITITVLSINLMGDGLRDALDPRMRH